MPGPIRVCVSCDLTSLEVRAISMRNGEAFFRFHAVKPERTAMELALINRFREGSGKAPLVALGSTVTLCRTCHAAVREHIRLDFAWLRETQG